MALEVCPALLCSALPCWPETAAAPLTSDTGAPGHWAAEGGASLRCWALLPFLSPGAALLRPWNTGSRVQAEAASYWSMKLVKFENKYSCLERAGFFLLCYSEISLVNSYCDCIQLSKLGHPLGGFPATLCNWLKMNGSWSSSR